MIFVRLALITAYKFYEKEQRMKKKKSEILEKFLTKY